MSKELWLSLEKEIDKLKSKDLDFLNDEKGVSPVVGSILLIMLTVVMVSLLANFLLNTVNESLETSKIVIENLENMAENMVNNYGG